ncbi:GNAT family N-acetyltransferase, partial [Pseudoalteromonas sp. 41-MNA-CIBAN-0057]|uniref:GNAT family N-acetyltransferase n=1 Tax=Pseudoalteromonas sp. 41-MNA-CIBAN-0057 TaxID=3140419 RepID=UPI003316A6A2
GWGFWAVSRKGGSNKSDDFIGMVGLNDAHADMPFSPAVEIGWRLHNDYWGIRVCDRGRAGCFALCL